MKAAAQQHAITEALIDVRAGMPGAMDRLVPLVYADLSRIAHRQLGLESPGHTLSTTALVHEAYLRLVDQKRSQWADRSQFYAVASHVMRRVLVDRAQRRRADRRGGEFGQRPIPLEVLESADDGSLATEQRADALLAVDEALDCLAKVDARQAQVIECRFFGGLTEAETAEAVGVTSRTVERDRVKARGWPFQELRKRWTILTGVTCSVSLMERLIGRPSRVTRTSTRRAAAMIDCVRVPSDSSKAAIALSAPAEFSRVPRCICGSTARRSGGTGCDSRR